MCFMYSKLSQLILFNMASSDHPVKNMVDYCRKEYATEFQRRLVDNFEKIILNIAHYGGIQKIIFFKVLLTMHWVHMIFMHYVLCMNL